MWIHIRISSNVLYRSPSAVSLRSVGVGVGEGVGSSHHLAGQRSGFLVSLPPLVIQVLFRLRRKCEGVYIGEAVLLFTQTIGNQAVESPKESPKEFP